MRKFPLFQTALAACTLALAGCINIQTVKPLAHGEPAPTISPDYGMPEILPKGLSRFEDSPFVFVHAEHASTVVADMLIPIPFVTDMAVSAANHQQDKGRHEHYVAMDTYALLEEKMAAYEHFQLEGGDYTLHMLIPLEECIDEVYRMSLMFQLEKEDWMGRYYYHLPTPLPEEDVGNPSEEELATFKRELSEGFDILMDIIEREINGEFDQPGKPVIVGSLYMVGGYIGGLASPEIFKVKDAVELEANTDSVIVRVPGDPQTAANNGGMTFGLHYFHRDQLHTYEMAADGG